MKSGLVLLTPDELRELVAEAVADGLAKAGARAEPSDILTCEQAADLLGLHPKTLPRYVRTLGLPALRSVGKQWRFSRSQLLAWMRERNHDRNFRKASAI